MSSPKPTSPRNHSKPTSPRNHSKPTSPRNQSNNSESGNKQCYCCHRFPPGYKFVPEDDELITYYLKNKVMNKPMPCNIIKDVELYKHNPWDLTENYSDNGIRTWYFFTPRERKYPNGTRPSRSAGDGYWKATGADKNIYYTSEVIGARKALVFYEGKPPKGNKTNWIMQEYRLHQPPRVKTSANDMRLDDWVLCKIYEKDEKSFKRQKICEDEDDTVEPLAAPRKNDHGLVDNINTFVDQTNTKFQEAMNQKNNSFQEANGLIMSHFDNGIPYHLNNTFVVDDYSNFNGNRYDNIPTNLLLPTAPQGLTDQTFAFKSKYLKQEMTHSYPKFDRDHLGLTEFESDDFRFAFEYDPYWRNNIFVDNPMNNLIEPFFNNEGSQKPDCRKDRKDHI